MLNSVKTIVHAEALASSNPNTPELKEIRNFPLLFNDATVTSTLESTFSSHFKDSKYATYTPDIARLQGSEDFGILATAVGKPSCFFLYGGTDPALHERLKKEGKMSEIPGNHSPFFAPVVQPTLNVGFESYVVSALTFLGRM